jgi:hypothetical protein
MTTNALSLAARDRRVAVPLEAFQASGTLSIGVALTNAGLQICR